MAGSANVCLFKDKECTQPLTLAELEEAYGKRQIIIRSEHESGAGNASRYDNLAVRFNKDWNKSVTPNIAYGAAYDSSNNHYYTKEYFETTS